MCDCIFAESKVFDWGNQKGRKDHLFKWREHELFTTWHQMKYRCYSPKIAQYADWGGRGIRVCEQWVYDFEKFVLDMGTRPPDKSIDRRDNDKGYCPHNCRWATRIEQAQNKRPYKTSKTGYSGIRLTEAGTYQARTLNTRIVLGCFATIDGALEAQRTLQKQTNPRSNNTSGIRGVTMDKKTGRWNVRKVVGEKRIYLGTTETLEEAKELYLSGKKKGKKKR